jgi:hypothetical protein
MTYAPLDFAPVGRRSSAPMTNIFVIKSLVKQSAREKRRARSLVRESSKLIERGAGYTVLPPSTIVARNAPIKAAPIRGLWSRGCWVLTAIAPTGRWFACWDGMIREQTDALIKSGAWKASRRQD